MAPPAADLLIDFRGTTATKQQVTVAENEYSQLIGTLRNGGLHASGRKSTSDGQVMVFISTPDELLAKLVQDERYRDSVNGVPSFSLPSVARDHAVEPLTAAERIRFTHTYICSSPVDSGLGIAPNAQPWNRVESDMALHDKEFNEEWITSWTRKKLGLGFSNDELQGIKNQFGEQIAMYFAFVSFYAKSLLVPTALGATFWYLHEPFNPYYSLCLSLWSVIFVEWWRLKERAIAVRWGSYGSARVELRRAQFQGANDSTDSQPDDSEFPWYKRESRIVASFPVILAFATTLTGLLTSIFIIEAFVTQLYTGPGVKYVGLAPTAMFLLFVPRLVGFYQKYAISLTGWENHVHESEHEKSLALKTFALSSIVACGGLYLSAFVYIPFGEQIMQLVQTTFFTSPTAHSDRTADQKVAAVKDASKMLNPDRLKNQVYAYLITNQVIGEFLELGVPAIARLTQKARGQVVETEAGKKSLKKVGWEDEKKADDLANAAITEEEKALVRHARKQVALPEYDVFGDYSEMITQFGYCVLWSACWSLAPIGALVNNWMELRGDAIKIATYGCRPIPRRTDTIGPWLDILMFLTWQGALINSALVYLF